MKVRHSGGEYEVSVTKLESALRSLPSDCRVITDVHVHEVAKEFLKGHQVQVLPAGEETKSLAYFGSCLSWLASSGASRRTTVVALGGGVIGDLVGFVAASYMRGVPYFQIPTTLLAMVDSSVGGKVAIDLPEGKNLAGAFYPPQKVALCTDALRSLPERQVTNGMAEILKYGLIMDEPLLSEIGQKGGDLTSVIERCVALKARVVEEDEHETTGRRAILNFGHTVGHAIEHATAYAELLHGEAIAVGMVVEARLGERLGLSQPGTAEAVRRQVRRLDLPDTHPTLHEPRKLIPAMRRDKKATAGKLAFSLLTRIGDCRLVPDVPEEEVIAALGGA